MRVSKNLIKDPNLKFNEDKPQLITNQEKRPSIQTPYFKIPNLREYKQNRIIQKFKNFSKRSSNQFYPKQKNFYIPLNNDYHKNNEYLKNYDELKTSKKMVLNNHNINKEIRELSRNEIGITLNKNKDCHLKEFNVINSLIPRKQHLNFSKKHNSNDSNLFKHFDLKLDNMSKLYNRNSENINFSNTKPNLENFSSNFIINKNNTKVSNFRLSKHGNNFNKKQENQCDNFFINSLKKSTTTSKDLAHEYQQLTQEYAIAIAKAHSLLHLNFKKIPINFLNCLHQKSQRKRLDLTFEIYR